MDVHDLSFKNKIIKKLRRKGEDEEGLVTRNTLIEPPP